MKNIYKLLFLTLVACSTVFYSCETTELEDLASPNGLSPDQADPDFLLNNIQLQYRSAIITFNNNGADTGRIDHLSGTDYFTRFGGGTMNNPWNQLYSGMIPDIAAVEAQNVDGSLNYHVGVSKIMQADVMLQLVDWLGDIVFSQANQPNTFPTPELDDDQAVYDAALAILDEGIALMGGSSIGTGTDLYYGGDASKWVRLGNTVRMRANLNLGNYTAVVNATNVIESTADDMEFTYGTNELQPDNRHPDYAADYRADGANNYAEHWLINRMVPGNGDLSGSTDPRRRYYFYRQNFVTPGNRSIVSDPEGLVGAPGGLYFFNGDGNQEVLSCSVENVPPHLEFTPDEPIWCSLSLGYWGRFFGNARGIPPDNFLRTATGVYPTGGSFDGVTDFFPLSDNDPDVGFLGEINAAWDQAVGLGKGGGGAGIEPIMLASFVDFMRAEASLQLGQTGPAATFLQSGMEKSIAKVMSFGALDASADTSNAPDAATVTAFIAAKVAEFNGAPDDNVLDGNGYPETKGKMEILGEQYFIAQYGAGADAFNFIRRTGHPAGMARNFGAQPGTFPSTVLYPTGEVSANPNINQRLDLTTQVFWDPGISNPANNQ